MDGRFLAVVFSVALGCGNFTGAPCCAQDQAPSASAAPLPSSSPSPTPKFFDNDNEKGNHPPEGRQFRENGDDLDKIRGKLNRLPADPREKFLKNLHRWETMKPDQRQKFRENLKHWETMKPEERKALKEMEEFRKQRMLREIDKSIQGSGLQLDRGARERYVQRYVEERRKIEEPLQKEMQEKRKPLIEAMLNRLKEEFSAKPSSPAPQPEPAALSPAQ